VLSPFYIRFPVQVSYRLRAVLVHEGQTSSSGHFYTLVLSGSSWILCDDMNIKHISTSEAAAAASGAYLCMYVQDGKFLTDDMHSSAFTLDLMSHMQQSCFDSAL